MSDVTLTNIDFDFEDENGETIKPRPRPDGGLVTDPETGAVYFESSDPSDDNSTQGSPNGMLAVSRDR